MPEPNSIVVASCNDDYIPVGPFAGTTLYTCARVIVRSTFILEYKIQKVNLPLYHQIDAFLEDRIRAWERNCSI
jgi:hypothetical protein